MDVTVFFGMAKPVRAPQIGPAKPYRKKALGQFYP
jgi:hypothetical protein